MKSTNQHHLSATTRNAFVLTEKRHLCAFIHFSASGGVFLSRLLRKVCLRSLIKRILIGCFLRKKTKNKKQKKRATLTLTTKSQKAHEKDIRDKSILYDTKTVRHTSVYSQDKNTLRIRCDVIFFFVFFFCDDGETDDAKTKRLFVLPAGKDD